MEHDRTRLSRVVSHALRHAPARYGLVLDPDGWGPVDDLLAALRRHRASWSGLAASDLQRMIATSDKPRFEMGDGRIRARYGHSLPDKIVRVPAEPPTLLFHGTTPEAARSILRQGLRPMRRQYVHLSVDEATARQVGARRTTSPMILIVRAADAHAAGVRFYPGEDTIWLADQVPSAFITALDRAAPGVGRPSR